MQQAFELSQSINCCVSLRPLLSLLKPRFSVQVFFQVLQLIIFQLQFLKHFLELSISVVQQFLLILLRLKSILCIPLLVLKQSLVPIKSIFLFIFRPISQSPFGLLSLLPSLFSKLPPKLLP